MKLILKAFWHRFWDDFRGLGNVKNEENRGRVALFLIFGVCKINCRFGAVFFNAHFLCKRFGPPGAQAQPVHKGVQNAYGTKSSYKAE